MKRLTSTLRKSFYLLIGSFFIFQNIISAQTISTADRDAPIPLIKKIATNIANPLITMFFGLGLAYFVFGVLRFIAAGQDEDARQKGRDHMLWGSVGLGIMFSAWAILRLATNTFGLVDKPINDLIK